MGNQHTGPAPAALRLIGGRKPGRDSGGRAVETPPAFKRKPPAAPSWLCAEAKAEWRRVIPGLHRLDLLKPEDRAILAAYCETWANWIIAVKDVRSRGQVLCRTTERGESIYASNPAVTNMRTLGRELRAFAAQFGLTPASEAALGRAGEGGQDDTPGQGSPFDGTGIGG